jgi:tyrosine-protein phosphatase YwqE
MFGLFSKRKAGKVDLGLLGADMHSHLLPGIDDGSPDLETSLRLVRGMMDLGYTKLITTPHIMWDMYQNTAAIVKEKEAELNHALRDNGIDITVRAAAEYFLDEHVEQLLKKNEPLLSISGKMILVEFSMAYPPQGLKDILFEMQMQGYLPVIAHPERYIYLERARDFYDELKETGCLFQLNLLSITGYYGKGPQELAQYLAKKSYYDLVGTDLHGFRHLDALHHPALEGQLKKIMDTCRIRNTEL